MQEVRLTPIRRGYDYQIVFNFPAGFLAEGEMLRAQLRRTPARVAALNFAVTREDDSVTLSLSGDDTADLPTRQHLMDLTLVLTGGVEAPIIDQRYVIPVEDHVTRAAA